MGSSDKQIQATNDSSIISKLSMVKQGYFRDSFISKFVNSKKRRSPLIHRGYYVRAVIIERALQKYLETAKDDCQIVSLGAGFDTSYHRLQSYGLLNPKCIYFDVDFPEVICQKEKATSSASQYKLVGCDLRDIASLEMALKLAGCKTNIPTLFLAECSVTYLNRSSSSALFQWITANFDSQLLLYEQIAPNDCFGHVMINHFNKIGSPLNIYCTALEEKQRLMDVGWTLCSVTNTYSILLDYLSKTDGELERIDGLEPFDEYEEWLLTCGHYILAHARQVGHVDGNVNTDYCVGHPEFTWVVQEKKDLQRYGHCSTFDGNNVVVFGGYKQPVCMKFNKDMEVVDTIGIPNTRLRSNIICWNNKIIVCGGCISGTTASEPFLYVICDSNSGIADGPEPRWRHTFTLIGNNAHVFGGRNKFQVFSDHWLLSLKEWKWKRCAVGGNSPCGRYSHSAVDYGSSLIVSGGLDDKLHALHDVWIFNTVWTKLTIQGQMRNRFGHTSHVFNDILFLVGGVDPFLVNPPLGVSVINLKTNILQEYAVPSTDLNSVALHGHSSVLISSTETGEAVIMILGGGGTFFSFGSHFNIGYICIPVNQFL